jgi:sugar lactone lactonase YvrE
MNDLKVVCRRTAAPILVAFISVIAPPVLEASEVRIWKSADRETVVSGTLENVSVDPTGTIELARKVTRLATIEEPFVFSAAAQAKGWVVGTGNSGRVLSIDPAGEVRELFAAEEPEIFAVLADSNGDVVVGSSPAGKVYRIQGGVAETLFDPEDTYIWGLARDTKGRLLVATGLPGRLYRVDSRGRVEVLFESPDRHVRSLLPQSDGSVLVGTAGQGLIVRIGPGGEVSTLHDAVQPEVLALVSGVGGTTYAAVLASEASRVDLSATPAKTEEKDGGEPSVTVVETGQTTIGSRGAGETGPRSAVLKITSDGRVENLAELADETIHSLLWHGGSLWLGTGEEGKLYRYVNDGLMQERELEERQITALVAGGAGAAAITANGSAIYSLHAAPVAEGTYTSKIQDAGETARFGNFLWEGDLPKGTSLGFSFRSGQSTAPDATWSDWKAMGCALGEPCESTAGRRHEIPLGTLPHGRYVQWQAHLVGTTDARNASPRLALTELTYAQENLRPNIEKLEVLDPGEILVPSGFNPQSQTFEPWSPNREGIFTSLRDPAETNESRLKTLWKKGYRTLRWSTEDSNGDELLYDLAFRPEAGWNQEDDGWLTMVEELDKSYYSFDASVLPDGVYRFRLRADDRLGHSLGESLQASEMSGPVVIDHTPPTLARVHREGKMVEGEVRDTLSPIRNAVYSVDAGPWQKARAIDGLVDGRQERLQVEIPPEARLLLLRVTDAALNVITFDLFANIP